MTERTAKHEAMSPAKGDSPVLYQTISICLAVVFAVVGLIFLLMPAGTLRFFNDLSAPLGLQPSPVEGISFYLILAVGYMYLVALLAWFMARHPENRFFPLLLVNAKLASSVLSLVFFLGFHRSLIYLTNGVVDGLIGLGVWFLCRTRRKMA